jgi:hypothetical protein
MRILDRKGNIPFVAYTGFSRRFYENESPLSIRNGDTACIRVICNRIDPALPFYTPGGSFFVNGKSRFPEATAAAGRKEPCSVCRSYGYESVALIPIRVVSQILGLIHVADPRDDRVPQEMVQTLEDGAMQLGAAIKRVRAEEELRKSNEALEERVKIGNSNPSMSPSGSIMPSMWKKTTYPKTSRRVIYRILQETLNNVSKHSRAGRVSIGLEKKDALLVFGISDDGIGFAPEQVVSLERSERGVGLASVRERTELTGGHFFISFGRQTATTIRIVWSLALGTQSVSI